VTEGVKPKNSISQMFVGSAFDPSPHGFMKQAQFQ